MSVQVACFAATRVLALFGALGEKRPDSVAQALPVLENALRVAAVCARRAETSPAHHQELQRAIARLEGMIG